MSHHLSSVRTGQSTRPGSLAVLLALILPVPRAAVAQVPAEYQGTWVPAKATCQSPSSVVLTADRLTLVNGADKQSIGGIEMAGPGYFAPDYNGIMAVLITEFDGQQPAIMTFNVGEKKGAAQVEFSPVMPGGNASSAAYNARITQLNLAKRFPLNKVTLKKCAGQQGADGAVPAKQASTRPAAPAGPSICAGNPRCVEVAPFAATVTDFRTSASGATKVVTVTMRFQNRTSAPLVLGYVQGSGIVTDDRGNRYTVFGQGAIRGIGEINNNTFDPKFTLQPGEASDARLEFQWTPQRGQIFGTTYDVELAVRQIDALEANQYQLGKEYALKLDGFTAGVSAATAQPQAGGAVAPATVAGTGAVGGSTPAAPAEMPDACAGKARCYGAGPFIAEVTQVTTSKVTYYIYVHLNVKVSNVTTQPLVLGWQNGSGVVVDDAGNRYAAKGVKGIGLVTSSAADPQFALNPGQSRAFTIDYVVRPGRAVVGTKYTADFVLQQLEILPSRQVRSVREYSVSYQDLTAGNGAAGSTGASSNGGTPAGGTSDSSAANAVNATAGAVKAVGKLFKSK
jgi:hypothetical protein